MILFTNSDRQLTDSLDAVRVLRDLLKTEDKIDQEKEHFYVIHLNTRSVIKMVELVSLGTINSSVVHPRETFRRAISVGLCSIIIAHTHPSENVEPSEEDIRTTKQMFEAGRILGIDVLDHLILGFQRYFSFRNNMTYEK